MAQPLSRTGSALLVLLLLSCTVAAADTLTITTPRAMARAGPDSKQGVLATVPQVSTFSLL